MAGMAERKLLSDAAELFNRKQYFECHEILEDEWSGALGAEKQFLQGLIQLAVGMYHAVAGNYKGAVNVLEKGLGRIEPFLPEKDGLDLVGLSAASEKALEKARRGLAGEDVVWTEKDMPKMRFSGG